MAVKTLLMTVMLCLTLNGCGIKGDLVRPSDIQKQEEEKSSPETPS